MWMPTFVRAQGCTHTHKHTHTLTLHIHTQTHTHKHTHKHKHSTYTHKRTHTLHIYTQTHTHTNTHTHSHTPHTHTHTQTQTLTHTNTQTLSYTHTCVSTHDAMQMHTYFKASQWSMWVLTRLSKRCSRSCLSCALATEMMSCECVFTYRPYDVGCLRTGCVLLYRLRATKGDWDDVLWLCVYVQAVWCCVFTYRLCALVQIACNEGGLRWCHVIMYVQVECTYKH